MLNDTYKLDTDCDICVMVDTYSIYSLGSGHLTHNKDGFHLVSDDQKLDYYQKPKSSYSVNADFFWYQIADTISIGDKNIQYYCFPKEGSVTKVRLACEELYKLL